MDKNNYTGVWCLSTSGERVAAGDWKPEMHPQGVLLVTEKASFLIGLHANSALKFGAMELSKSPLVADKESFDSKSATDAIIAAYAGQYYQDPDDRIWDVYGAPAAELCRQYSLGNRGAGDWDLPTVAQLLAMYEHRDEINDCLMAMGGRKLTPGWYWSSIEHSSDFAWYVGMYDGSVGNDGKYGYHHVRAVSAFQL